MYKQNIEDFLSILEDDGALLIILGYDAIYVEEKDYMVILNRKQMIIKIDNKYMIYSCAFSFTIKLIFYIESVV